MGGARNVGIKPHIKEKFDKAKELMRAEPDLALRSVLQRFNLPISTYYRLDAKEKAKHSPAQIQAKPLANGLSFENIAGGIVAQHFERELIKVTDNIAGAFVKKNSPRSIIMTFEFLPDKDGKEVAITVSATSKLVQSKNPIKTAWFGSVNGKPSLVDQDPNQLSLFDQSLEKNDA